MIHRNSIFTFVFLLSVAWMFSACSKNPSPKRVEKKIVEGTWKIGQAKVDGETLTASYNGVKFVFRDYGTIDVSGEIATAGSWYCGEGDDPTLLFMSFPISEPTLSLFSDDWIVDEMSKRECILRRNESTTQEDVLVFRRID